MSRSGSSCSFSQFESRKEKTEFEARSFVRVRAMDCVVFDIRGPLLADGAFFGVGGVGGAHELSQVGDGIFLLQGENHDRPAGHKIGQRIEE
jgi:hypothetical protein